MPGVNPVQPKQGMMQQGMGMLQMAKGVADAKNTFGSEASPSQPGSQASTGVEAIPSGTPSATDTGAGSKFDPINNEARKKAMQRRMDNYGGGEY